MSESRDLMPDLMSFHDAPVANADKKEDWSSLEHAKDACQNRANSAYNQSIKDVLSLYNTTIAVANTAGGLPLNQQQSYHPPGGTFSAMTYGWQNEVSRNRGMTFPQQAYQSYQSQADMYVSNQQYSMHFPAQTCTTGSSNFNTLPAMFQQPHHHAKTEAVPSVPVTSQIAQSNANASTNFNASVDTPNYGNSNTNLSTNYHFPRPASLGELKNFQLEKFMLQKSPSHAVKAFEQRSSLKINNNKTSPSHEPSKS